ncbi:MAG: VOC family protein [Nostoc sp. LLA-1]|nr:VOC family protein [Cyanocohniella sp. LLY]
MWLNAIDHIQVTSSTEAKDSMLFFYSQVLGLKEITKPEALQANEGAWYVLGNIQIHVSTENSVNNATSRRHICFQVNNLPAFAQHLQNHGVEIINGQPIPFVNRFFIRDPGGNRLEIAEFTKNMGLKPRP